MKNITLQLLLVIIFLQVGPIFITNIQAQWVQTAGPVGGELSCIERVGSEIWVGSNDGIYVSPDDGNNWKIHPLFDNFYCFGIEDFGDTIFVIYTHSLDRTEILSITSEDGGETWSKESVVDPIDISPGYKKVEKINDAFLVTDYHGGGFITNDLGKTWIEFSVNGEPDFYSYSTAVNEKGMLYTEGSIEINDRKLYYFKSENQPRIEIQNPYEFSDFFLIDTSIFLIAGETVNYRFKHLVKSDNYGQTWDTIYSTNVEASIFQDIQMIGNKIFLSDNLNCFVGTNNGTVWTLLPSKPNYTKYISSENVETSPGSFLSLLRPYGVIKLNEFAESYDVVSDGILAQSISYLTEHNGTLYTSNSYDFFKSKDEGSSWEDLNKYFNAVRSSVSIGDTIIFLNDHYTTLSLIRSFDNGQSWDSISVPFKCGRERVYSLIALNGDLYLNGDDAIMKSNDLGLTWTPLNAWEEEVSGSCIDHDDKTGHIAAVNGIIYSITNGGFVFRYNFDNENWDQIHCFRSTGAFQKYKIKEVDNLIVLYGQRILKLSSDNGVSFYEPLMNGIPKNNLTGSIKPSEIISYQGIWFGSFYTLGVYYSKDQGNNWNIISNPSKFDAWGGLVVLNDVLYSGSYNSSVWKRSGKIGIVNGNVFRDMNNNGIKESGEPVLSEIAVKNLASNTFTVTNSDGRYSMLTDNPGDTITIKGLKYFMTSNPEFNLTDASGTDKNFGIYISDTIRDLAIDMTNTSAFRPGFSNDIVITVHNYGGVDTSGLVKLILDKKLLFMDADPNVLSHIGDTITWKTDRLTYNERAKIVVRIKTIAQVFDTVRLFSSVDPINGDITPNNNFSSIKEEVLHAYDPNDKTCLQGEYFTPEQLDAGEEFDYVIRFQNEGNFMAENVRVVDALDKNFDLSTIKIISASHPMHWQLDEDNRIVFYFDDIDLPGKTTDEAGSHGFLKFSIKCKEDTKLGVWIYNEANIYFDNNEAVETNKVATQIGYPPILSSDDTPRINFNDKILVYPNPASDYLRIEIGNFTKEKYNISIVDVNGRKVINAKINKSKNEIQLNNLIPGPYFGIVTAENGERVGSFRFVFK